MANHSKKINLAKEQLEDAIELLINGRYISCLTLAGAAEEVFTALVDIKLGKNPFNIIHELINHDLAVEGHQNISRGSFRKVRNRARNLVKHHDFGDEESVHINRQHQALATLGQAMISADLLDVKYKNKRKYNAWLKQHRDT
ncbi:hypothetical protein RQY88_004274 [Vibrio vulnificus]|nr:hypothetical protein [Vibrio vulnificus]ELH9602946.1 hypothetical protein [Vibrio vulnificus]ELH9617295.1 hypothetical protein [Vibrio vulnificus]